MPISNLHPLTPADFAIRLKALMTQLESSVPTPYFDIEGLVTIGIGANIDVPGVNRNRVFVAMGLTPTDIAAVNNALAPPAMTSIRALSPGTARNQALQNHLNAALGAGRSFSMSPTQIDQVFLQIAQDHENAIAPLIAPTSLERLALVSLHFNSPNLVGTGLRTALSLQDPYGARAEAWYQIRYAHKDQLHTRRYAEAALFGLYGDSVPAADAAAQALAIYRMYTAHGRQMTQSRVVMVDYDSLYSAQLASAQANLNSAGLGAIQVQDLPSTLNPARDALVAWLNVQLPTGNQLSASAWNSAAIYVAPSGSSPTPLPPAPLDARVDDWRGAGMANNLLIGGSGSDAMRGGVGDDVLFGDGGNDWLDGGKGSDALYGGIGDDKYIVDAEALTKSITDSDGKGAVFVRATVNGKTSELSLSGYYIGDGSGTWTNLLGTVHITLANGTYKASMLDGSGTVVQFGTNFDPTQESGALGINLVDQTLYAQTQTGTTARNIFVGSYAEGSPTGSAMLNAAQSQSVSVQTQASVIARPATEVVANDLLIGGGGNDELEGYLGNDRLEGGDGDDLLAGGYGNDIIIGGAGNDVVLPDEVVGANPGYSDVDTSAPPPGHGGNFFVGYTGDIWGAGNTWLGLGDGPGFGISLPNTPGIRDVGNDVIDVGAGNDLVFAGVGRDTVDLGDGDDIAFGQGGADVLHGGGGADLIYGDGDLQQFDTSLSFTAAAEHGNDTIDGGDGNDRIYGGGGADVIFGGADNDVISGDGQWFSSDALNIPVAYQGNDYIDGGDGDDNLAGMGGADTILGGNGDDILEGDYGPLAAASHGADYLDGGDGNDTLYGEGGADTLVGGAGTNFLYGGDGDDLLMASGAADTLDGGAGHDTLRIADGTHVTLAVTSFVGADADTLVLEGGLSSDGVAVTMNPIYSASSQTATLTFADSSASITISSQGASSVLGSSLESVVFADGLAWNQADLRDHLRGIATEGNDQLFALNGENDSLNGLGGNDRFYGGNGNDAFYGGDGNDWMSGQDGSDVLDGGAGDDEMQGGAGNDIFIGGTGNDAMRDDSTTSNDVYRYSLGDGFDIIDDRGGTDRLELGAGIATTDVRVIQEGSIVQLRLADSIGVSIGNTLASGALDSQRMVETIQFADGTSWDVARIKQELLKSTPGADRLYGFETNDTIDGAGGDDVINGMDGDDVLHGGTGNDTLWDQSGNDALFGDAGNDGLLGGSGDDVLVGGTGNDSMNGGAGANVYRFASGDGSDSITIDNGATDRIEFTAGVNAAATSLRHVADSLVLSYGTGDSITVALFDALTGQMNATALDSIRFADGTTWTGTAIEAEVTRQSLIVTSGADTRYLSANGDTLDAGDGDDTLYGLGGNDNLGGGNGKDKLYGGIGNDTLQGGADNDTLEGEDGNDTLIGGDGADTLNGGWGNDVLDGGAGSDTLSGLQGDDLYLFGRSDGQDSIGRDYGGSLTSTLRFKTGVGSSEVVAKQVADTFWGGMNALELSISGTTDKVTISKYFDISSRPVQRIEFADGTVWDATRIAQEVASNEPKVLTGTGAADTLVGGGGNDTFYGLGGGDTLIGKAGDDYYFVFEDAFGGFGGSATSSSDVIVESAGEGIDSVLSSVSWVLAANVENLTLMTDSFAVDGTGNALNNVLVGNEVSNRLDGGAGADSMSGAEGNDTYVVDNAGDVVTEAANEGTDTVESSIGWTLGANLENLTLTGTAAINATGNTLANVLTGNSAANTLNGGAGADTMAGGAGNDSYVVDNTSDVVTEAAGAGTDTVQSSVTLTLGANVENLTLTGSGAISATGNGLDNMLVGNSANNTLTGGAGNDTLDGGTGTDTMVGGTGNDTYYVNVSADVVTEAAGEGTDTVNSLVTLTLASNVENLTLTGTAAISGNGNTLNNLLVGNSAANTLNGGAGNDTMQGGAGNDIYVVDVATDVVTENAGEGTDLVQSGITWTLGANVENLTLTGSGTVNGSGNGLDNVLTGNSANNTLSGGAGNDTLDGGAGTDTMVGGTGNDTYVVNVTTDVVTEAAGEGTDTVLSTVALTLGSNVENLTLTGSSALNGTGNSLNNVLIGNAGANVLAGTTGDDTYDGAAGNDTLTDNSATSNDTYRWGIGSGLDALTDSGGSLDHVDLFAGIAKSQLRFARNGNNLELTVTGQSDKLTLNNWYLSSANQIEEFRLSDGSKVLASEVQSLVGAMATFSAAKTGAITTHRMVAQPVRHFGELTMPWAR